ncbi:MAG: type II toxin-antitoxin system RelE/ParE family toxin [Anaerolineaceae bacterium]|nr:type II toxin-antitoxin system RelE/ParE family toxin [Anaerolineaceae bacterium]
MEYKIVVTPDAEADLDRIIRYLLYEIKNKQAASSVLNDFEETKNVLSICAGTLKLCDNPGLKSRGYRRINFISHKYFLMYRIQDESVIIDNIFHSSQDFENKMI